MARPQVKIIGHRFTPRSDRKFCDKLEVYTTTVKGDQERGSTYLIDGVFTPGTFTARGAMKVSYDGRSGPYYIAATKFPEALRIFIRRLERPADILPTEWDVTPEGYEFALWTRRHDETFYQEHKTIALANATGWASRDQAPVEETRCDPGCVTLRVEDGVPRD